MKKFKTFLALACFSSLMASCEKEEEKNLPPVVNAGPDQIITLTTSEPATFQLSGVATDDKGPIVGYIWSQLSGPGAATIVTPAALSTAVTAATSGTYEFQLLATDKEGASGVDVVRVTVNIPTVRILTLQPNNNDGHDAIVAMRATDGGGNASGNHNHLPELNMTQWTYDSQGWGQGTNRSFIKFTGLSSIPAGATIISAKLSLYGLSQSDGSGASPQGNSHYSGSPYNENATWIKRVTGGDWNESTITWNNMPGATDVNRVAIPASTSRWSYDVVDLDVTQLVKDIISSGQNYGFCLQLQNEQIYRTLLFASSEAASAAKRPKLVVEYR